MNSDDVKTINAKLDRLEHITLMGVKEALDIEEAALLTGFSKGHLYRLTSARQIPFYKMNRKVYFKKSELEAWLLSHKVLSDDELNRKATTYTAIRKI